MIITNKNLSEVNDIPPRIALPMKDMAEGLEVQFTCEYDEYSEKIRSITILHAGYASIEEINDFVFSIQNLT